MGVIVDVTLAGEALCGAVEVVVEKPEEVVEEVKGKKDEDKKQVEEKEVKSKSSRKESDTATIRYEPNFENHPPYLDPLPGPLIQIEVGQEFFINFGEPQDPDGDEVEGKLNVDSLGDLGFSDELNLIIPENFTSA